MATRNPWSRAEVEAIVADYFQMLTLHLQGQSYSKTRHRKALATKLQGRSDGSIEQKHRNISAVLEDLHSFSIPGYKRLSHYQALLADVVAQRLATDAAFQRAALAAAEQPAIAPTDTTFDALLVDPPAAEPMAAESSEPYRLREHGIFRDYLAIEATNRSLGEAGETYVLAYERYRLCRLGRERLSERVEHVAKTKGDGLGFDILSFEEDGRERFIEVKTTAFGKSTPFYASRNEVECSKEYADHYRVCRLFEFRQAPQMFELTGSIASRCALDPITYLARLR